MKNVSDMFSLKYACDNSKLKMSAGYVWIETANDKAELGHWVTICMAEPRIMRKCLARIVILDHYADETWV